MILYFGSGYFLLTYQGVNSNVNIMILPVGREALGVKVLKNLSSS